jgi:hypothetical protein
MMCLQQEGFGSTRSLAGGGKADRWSDAADTVQVAIGFGDMLDDPTLAASHVTGADDRISDLAFERRCKAMPYPGKANFELIGIHGALPWLLCSKHPRQTLIVSQVSRLIWCADNIVPVRPPHERTGRSGFRVSTQTNVNSRIARGPLDSRRSRVVPNPVRVQGNACGAFSGNPCTFLSEITAW